MSETHVQYKIHSNMHNFSNLEMKILILSENLPYFAIFCLFDRNKLKSNKG